MNADRKLICFCKHPNPGFVKSRLSKDVGDEVATHIYKILLETILINVHKQFDTYLYCYPNSDHSFLDQCKNKYRITLKDQCGDDLGMRMYNAIKNHLGKNKSVILIGSDCIELNSDYINNAFSELAKNNDVVISPTVDGGYALIGANKKIDLSIFTNILWSTNKVFKQSKEKIDKLNWKMATLPTVRDIDTYNDYDYFSKHGYFKHLFDKVNAMQKITS